MKTFTFFLWSAAAVFALNGALFSQAPQPPQTPIEALQKMKARNAALLEKQTATLLKLNEVAKEAQQIKFLGKRS